MANTESKEMHNKDVAQQMWRPATAITLVLGWIGLLAGGIDVPVAFQGLAGTAVVGLGLDRSLYKRRAVDSQAQSGDPK